VRCMSNKMIDRTHSLTKALCHAVLNLSDIDYAAHVIAGRLLADQLPARVLSEQLIRTTQHHVNTQTTPMQYFVQSLLQYNLRFDLMLPQYSLLAQSKRYEI